MSVFFLVGEKFIASEDSSPREYTESGLRYLNTSKQIISEVLSLQCMCTIQRVGLESIASGLRNLPEGPARE